ncbi:hypothetical protein TNCV_1870591 [Trichonephila clavipes]|nr:hypothetical protein TNCV_1870591 [Trichonephila clavipes]
MQSVENVSADTLIAATQALCSNPGKGMDVYKCIVAWSYSKYLYSREGSERDFCGRPLIPPQGALTLHWRGTKQNRTVTYMVLKATANDRRKNSSP